MIVTVAKRRNWGPIQIGAVALPFLDFLLKIGPPRPIIAPLLTSAAVFSVLLLVFNLAPRVKPKTLSRLLVFLVVGFCILGIGYVVTDAEYVAEAPKPNGGTARVVLGYELKADLDKQIKNEAEAALAERDRERDPLQNVASPVSGAPGESNKDQVRDADKAPAFKTEDQIRDERVSQVVSSSGDPAAPYTEASMATVAYSLLALWLAMFGCAAASIGILTIASRLVMRRGELKPRAV
jgi:hypothetical protein